MKGENANSMPCAKHSSLGSSPFVMSPITPCEERTSVLPDNSSAISASSLPFCSSFTILLKNANARVRNSKKKPETHLDTSKRADDPRPILPSLFTTQIQPHPK